MGEFIASVAIIALVATGVFIISARLELPAEQRDNLRQQAVERGYALYCPTDGKWAWKGECDQ